MQLAVPQPPLDLVIVQVFALSCIREFEPVVIVVASEVAMTLPYQASVAHLQIGLVAANGKCSRMKKFW